MSSQYVLTGEDAKAAARENIKKMAVITTESLRVRTEPVFEGSENVVGAVAMDERYEVLSQGEGWVEIEQGFISTEDGNARVEYCLNEARKLDMKTMAVNQYGNLLVSKVSNYLNVRSSPTQDEGMGNVIGKLPSRAAADILETSEDGQWYKIKSGAITGYVSADPQYIATGQEARDLALQEATLMAVVKVDGLRVRTEPSTDSQIWTQLTMEEKYPVLDQLDGWVQIELDTGRIRTTPTSPPGTTTWRCATPSRRPSSSRRWRSRPTGRCPGEPRSSITPCSLWATPTCGEAPA